MMKTNHEIENAGFKSDGFKILKLHSHQHKTHTFQRIIQNHFVHLLQETFLGAELSSTAENKQNGIITKFTIAGSEVVVVIGSLANAKLVHISQSYFNFNNRRMACTCTTQTHRNLDKVHRSHPSSEHYSVTDT